MRPFASPHRPTCLRAVIKQEHISEMVASRLRHPHLLATPNVLLLIYNEGAGRTPESGVEAIPQDNEGMTLLITSKRRSAGMTHFLWQVLDSGYPNGYLPCTGYFSCLEACLAGNDVKQRTVTIAEKKGGCPDELPSTIHIESVRRYLCLSIAVSGKALYITFCQPGLRPAPEGKEGFSLDGYSFCSLSSLLQCRQAVNLTGRLLLVKSICSGCHYMFVRSVSALDIS